MLLQKERQIKSLDRTISAYALKIAKNGGKASMINLRVKNIG